MLRIEEISKTFRKRQVVKQVSFSVKAGEVVGLLGPNGAGKTTSFYMAVGLLRPDAGHVYFEKRDITCLPMYKRARIGIGYLPQNMSIFRKLSVEENLIAVMQLCGIQGLQQKRLLSELLDRFQINSIRTLMGSALSGGERRRVEIARTLIIHPKILLLDEPFAGVDPKTVQEIQKIIKTLSHDGIGILITDHNVRETLSICHRTYILSSGKIVAQGLTHEIMKNKFVQNDYLGESFKY